MPESRADIGRQADGFLKHTKKKQKFFVFFGGVNQFVAGLLGECLEVFHRAGIGRDDFERFAGLHVGQRFLAAQNG